MQVYNYKILSALESLDIDKFSLSEATGHAGDYKSVDKQARIFTFFKTWNSLIVLAHIIKKQKSDQVSVKSYLVFSKDKV